MPGANTALTDREKCAIFAYKYGILPDIKTAFFCADDRSQAELLTLRGLRQRVSSWHNSEKFKQFEQYCESLINNKELEAIKQANQQKKDEEKQKEREGESEATKTEREQSVANIDYYDPKNQKKQINRIIARSQDDPKTQLDAIKAIQQTQRDDRQAAKDNQIQRFYTPITCKTCPLMEKARKKAVNG